MRELRIRPEQMEALGAVPLEALRASMCDQLRRHWKPLAERIGEESISFFVDQAIERCSFYEIDMRRDHFRYLNVMALLGADFDEELEWTKEILEMRALRGSARIDRLIEIIKMKIAGGDL